MSPLRYAPYVVSLPERLLRSVVALTGGFVKGLSEVTLPAAFRRTKLYRTMVENTLRFLVERVGDVEGAYPEEGRLENYLTRRTAGNGIELLGLLAFRASPVWVLAALADLSGAGRKVIQEIADSLQHEGLLERGSTFASMDQILDGLEKSAGRLADSMYAPPLNVAGLRKEWQALREDLKSIPPRQRPSPEQVNNNWQRIKQEAAAQGLSTFQLSSLLALSAMRGVYGAGRSTGRRLVFLLLNHYSSTLSEIHHTGYWAYWTREFAPYMKAAVSQFSPRHPSLTQRLFSRRRKRKG